WQRADAGLPVLCTHFIVDQCPAVAGFSTAAGETWIGFGGHVFSSRDGGVSWSPASSQLDDVSARVAGLAGAQSPLAPTRHGRPRSLDGGASWQGANTGLPADTATLQLLSDPATGGLYLATGHSGIFRSSDGGSSWQSLAGAPDADAPRLALDSQ